MDNGVYIAVARQAAMFRNMDITAGNIANSNTTGYQSEHLLFGEHLVNNGNQDPISFASDVASYRNTGVGELRSTGNQLDVAINSEGYFTVDTPNGNRYTRAGNFHLSDQGTLITPEGFNVLNSNGQSIDFPAGVSEVVIDRTGNITADGQQLGAIGIVTFSNENLMERQGARLYSSEIEPTPATNIEITQGALEQSNVQPIRELTHMLTVSGSTAGTSRYIEVVYDLQRRFTTTWTQQQ